MAVFADSYQRYTDTGMRVVALRGNTPDPLCGGAFGSASVAAEWAKQVPDANIGVQVPLGTAVITVDPHEGGASALRQLCMDANVSLPKTWCARTPRGGLQIWLLADVTQPGRVADGVYVTASPCYIPVAPTARPDGSRFEWITEYPVAAIPSGLAALVGAAAPGSGASLLHAEMLMQHVLGATPISEREWEAGLGTPRKLRQRRI